jgi:hypothetical protein
MTQTAKATKPAANKPAPKAPKATQVTQAVTDTNVNDATVTGINGAVQDTTTLAHVQELTESRDTAIVTIVGSYLPEASRYLTTLQGIGDALELHALEINTVNLSVEQQKEVLVDFAKRTSMAITKLQLAAQQRQAIRDRRALTLKKIKASTQQTSKAWTEADTELTQLQSVKDVTDTTVTTARNATNKIIATVTNAIELGLEWQGLGKNALEASIKAEKDRIEALKPENIHKKWLADMDVLRAEAQIEMDAYFAGVAAAEAKAKEVEQAKLASLPSASDITEELEFIATELMADNSELDSLEMALLLTEQLQDEIDAKPEFFQGALINLADLVDRLINAPKTAPKADSHVSNAIAAPKAENVPSAPVVDSSVKASPVNAVVPGAPIVNKPLRDVQTDSAKDNVINAAMNVIDRKVTNGELRDSDLRMIATMLSNKDSKYWDVLRVVMLFDGGEFREHKQAIGASIMEVLTQDASNVA